MTLYVFDYENVELHKIHLTQETFEKFGDDTDYLVYDKLGYKESSTSYIIGEVEEKEFDESELLELYEETEEDSDN